MSNQLPLVMTSGLSQRLQPGNMVTPASIQTITNSDAVTQSAGMIVRGTGPGTCVLAQADAVVHAANLIGARESDVLAGASGTVLTFEPGLRVRLAAPAAAGDEIYLSAAVGGVGTNIKPAIPVLLGYCFAYELVGGVDYADLAPDQPQANNSVLLLTKGDLLTNDGTTTVALPVGSDGKVLTANSGAADGIEWSTPAGGSNFAAALTNGEGAAPIVIASPVYVSGASAAKLAKADDVATSAVIGLWLSASTAPGASGSCATSGIVTATTAEWDAVTGGAGGLTAGTLYFLDAVTAGRLTSAAPSTPGQVVTQCGRALNTTQMVLQLSQPLKL